MSIILWGTALVTIPIVIHLWHRQKTVPIQWGAMQFLLETPLKLRRKQKIEHWLLMLMRMAILFLMALALARPIVEGVTYASSTPMDVVLVLDHSLSMGRRAGGGGTLFDESIRTAERIADLMPGKTGGGGGATVAVVLAEHSPRVITPIPVLLGSGTAGDDWPKVLQRLRETKPGMSDANIPAAVQAAVELSARGRNTRKVIVVISDDHRANWMPSNDAAWRLTTAGKRGAATSPESAIPIYSIPVSANTAAPNISVGRVVVQPAFLGVHRPAQITAAITNTGGANLANIPVRLTVDGRDVGSGNQQIAQLAPGQSVTVRFEHFFADAGSHYVRIKADTLDGLEADNTATTAVTVAPRLPVLIVDGQRTPAATYPSSAYLTLAMQPGGESGGGSFLLPKVISVAEFPAMSFDQYPIVILNDVPRLPAETVARLAEFVQQGNGLWIILGARTEESFVNNVLAKSPLFPATAKRPVTTDDAGVVGIDIKEPDHPTLALITASQQNALAGASLRAWWPIVPPSQMHTILATTTPAGATSGDPLVSELILGSASNAGGGRVILWTTSVSDIAWNNLPFLPNFVPLVNETLFHLAAGQTAASGAGRQRQLDAGQPLLWSGPIRPLIESATLVAPDSTVRTLQPQLRGDKYILTDNDTSQPGLYELRFKPAEIPQPVFFSVNIDPAELNPAPLAVTEVQWLRDHHYLNDRLTLEQFPRALNAQLTGLELWWPAAILLLLLVVAEVAMTWRLARRQTEVDPENAGLITPAAHAAIGGGVPR